MRVKGSFVRRIPRLILAFVALAVLLFIATPVLIVVPMSFSAADALAFPPASFSLRWYRAIFESSAWTNAFSNSLTIAFISSVISLVTGSLAAFGVVRSRGIFMRLTEMNFLAPMLVPDIIAAISLYLALAQFGLIGTYSGIVIGHVTRSAPFVVLIVGLALRSLGDSYEIAAYSLGASRWTVLVRVTAPLIMPSLVAAWVLAFLVSFDEVIITLFVSGSYVTVPKLMFTELSHEISPAITAISSIMVFLTLVFVSFSAWLLRKSNLEQGIVKAK